MKFSYISKKTKDFLEYTNLRIFLFILIPCFLVMIFSVLSLFTFQQTYKNTLKDSYVSSLKSLSSQQESYLQNISHSISLLSENEQFFQAIESSGIASENILYAQKIMRQIRSNYPVIDSISVLNRVDGQVYTQNTIHDAEKYFSTVYPYENYDYTYWKTYSTPFSEDYVLPPTVVNSDSGQKLITPMVFTKLGKKYMKNLIIVNLDLSYFLSAMEQQPIFKNSFLSFVNKTTKQNFCSRDSAAVLDTELFNLLTRNSLDSFDYTVYDEKSFVVSFSPSYSILGYVYMVVTPYSVIHDSIPLSIQLLFWLNGFVFIMALIFSIKGTNTIYRPIKKVINLFSDTAKDEKNSLDALYDHVSNVLESNDMLSKSLPLIKEQQLIHILNSSEHYLPDDFTNTLEFSNPYFCSVIAMFNPTKSFYEKYDSITEKTIELELYNLVKTEFLAHFSDIYVIPSTEHTLYILLNTDTPDSSNTLKEIFERLDSLLSHDAEDLQFSFASGSTYTGIEGLKQSHQEATNNIFKTTQFKRIRLNISNPQTAADDILFTYSDELALYNHLIAFNIDEAKKMIGQILEKNYDHNISNHKLSQLFTDVFSVIFKVMRAKKIEYDPDEKGDMALIGEFISSNPSQTQKNLYEFIEILRKYSDYKKIDPQAVISYIQEHYTENIYLETLAEKFNTSASYLSRLIKKETSFTFSEYLNTLRINEAKKLLATTQKPIKTIYELVGYNNRNTFIRLFKSIAGTTPSEYRTNQTENQ